MSCATRRNIAHRTGLCADRFPDPYVESMLIVLVLISAVLVQEHVALQRWHRPYRSFHLRIPNTYYVSSLCRLLSIPSAAVLFPLPITGEKIATHHTTPRRIYPSVWKWNKFMTTIRVSCMSFYCIDTLRPPQEIRPSHQWK